MKTHTSLFSFKLTPEQVENYLYRHPNFFEDHIHLLEHLTIPHPSGTAISLIAKQLDIYRAKQQTMENRLTELIDIAKANDLSAERMHRLTLALLETFTLEQLIVNLERVLITSFAIDFVILKLIGKPSTDDSATAHLFIAPDDKQSLEPFHHDLNRNRPRCGLPTAAQARILFAESALDVQSCALIPLTFKDYQGLLAIGSRKPERFKSHLGHLFLAQIGALVSSRLSGLV
jgi:uncharacterized protein YigA (DUF484 family)